MRERQVPRLSQVERTTDKFKIKNRGQSKRDRLEKKSISGGKSVISKKEEGTA